MHKPERETIYGEPIKIESGNPLERQEIRKELGYFLLDSLQSYSSANFPSVQREMYARHRRAFKLLVDNFIRNPNGFEVILVDGKEGMGVALVAPDAYGSTIVITHDEYELTESDMSYNRFENLHVTFGRPSPRRHITDVSAMLPPNITRYNATRQEMLRTKLVLLPGKRLIAPFISPTKFDSVKKTLNMTTTFLQVSGVQEFID